VVKLSTNFGGITIELNAEKAPITVANFLKYVENGFYDGLIFHRVINDFMIQGGGFDAGMKQKTTEAEIENEADNGLKNDKYTIAMARTSAPHSASSQFFINVNDNDFLNHTATTSSGWGYCVFGKVTEGMDVIDKITSVETGSKGGHQDVPVEPVIIEKATLS
jgi:peptidyl-prolyl cis-trans isomerase B (cyclophilin B)